MLQVWVSIAVYIPNVPKFHQKGERARKIAAADRPQNGGSYFLIVISRVVIDVLPMLRRNVKSFVSASADTAAIS